MERYSLGIIKPDAVEQNREIFLILEKRGLKIVEYKEILFNKKTIIEIYKEISQKNYFQEFCDFMTSGKCIAFIAKGENAITLLNELVGDTCPHKAKPGTIRNIFGSDIRKNAIHSSSDKKHFQKELKLIFPELNLDQKNF